MKASEPLDLSRLAVRPLKERRSLSRLEDILVEPVDDPPPLTKTQDALVAECADRIRAARECGAGVMLIYGAHLIKNGGQLLLIRLLEAGWLQHLATNGAGSIHDWEFAYHGRSTESVRDNVAEGCFGTWDETGRYLNLAQLVGGIRGDGYGQALGRFIFQDGCTLPDPDELAREISAHPDDPLTAARADLLVAMRRFNLKPGIQMVLHPRRNANVFANAFRHHVPLTVHPGIGYDIFTNHPMFHGAAIGRAGAVDFRRFAAAVETLDGGVVLSIGSAIMGPQVFEKAMSCVNNLRLQAGRPVVHDHTIYVVDLQDGGGWDWSAGEPPADNPAYYLRFCKSYARMGGDMRYVQCDNVAFLHHLFHRLKRVRRASAAPDSDS
jgi:hypothetical protein